MRKRLLFVGLLGMTLVSSTGCRSIVWLHDTLLCKWQSRRYPDCGCSCERYYGPMFSEPADCCDPCDDWGNFTGRRYWTGCSAGRNPGCSCGSEGMGPGSGPTPDALPDSMPDGVMREEVVPPGQPVPSSPGMRSGEPSPAPPPSMPPASRPAPRGAHRNGRSLAADPEQTLQPIRRTSATLRR